MRYTICYLLLFFLISCVKNDRVEIVNDNCKPVRYCLVQMLNDTIEIENTPIIHLEMNYIPLYIGKDTGYINLKNPALINEFIYDIGMGSNQRKFHIPDLNNSEIYLDTTININHRSFKSHNYINDFEMCDCEGYAYFIKNISNDTLIMGEGKNIPLVLQGLNLLGEWKDLHEAFIYLDNYGVGLLLPPRNIALFSIPKIKLDNYKRFRVRYNNFISNSFQ